MQKLNNYLNSSSVDGDRILPPRDYLCDEYTKITFFDHRKNLDTAIRLYEEAKKTFTEIMVRIKANSDGSYHILEPKLKEDVTIAFHFIAKNLYQAESWGEPAKRLLATVKETAEKMGITLPEPTKTKKSQLRQSGPASLFERPEKKAYATRADETNRAAEEIITDGLVRFIVQKFF